MNTQDTVKKIYVKSAMAVVPRIIGSLDRNELSSTRGCFDRQYWAWKLKDIPNASLQYGIYFLALTWNAKGNKFYRNNQIVGWICQAVKFWMDIQHKNGSFDQCYPGECSVGTTAYTLISMLKAKEITGSLWDDALMKDFERHVNLAADYFYYNEETYGNIANHTALFAYANLLLSDYYGGRFSGRYSEAMEKLEKLQSKEGWFVEYEGSDPCYQTQNIYYLAECFYKTNDNQIFEMLQRAISNYLIYCFHPDGTVGGSYGSRNTEIYYPAGFEMMAAKISDAKAIASWMKKSLSLSRVLMPRDLDLENSMRLAVNYLIADKVLGGESEEAGSEWVNNMKWSGCGSERYFEECAQFFKNSDKYYAVIGASKGGVVKIFNKKEEMLAYEDSGYIGHIDGKPVTTHRWQKAKCLIDDNTFECQLKIYQVDGKKMDVGKFFTLRIISLLIKSSRHLRDFLKRTLARKLVISKKEVNNCEIVRNFRFESGKIVIEDKLVVKNDNLRVFLTTGRSFNPIHMASSGYYNESHLQKMENMVLNNNNHLARMEISI